MIFKRISKRVSIIFADLKRDLFNFPFNITVVNFFKNIFCVAGRNNKISNYFKNKRDKQIYNYLYTRNSDVFDKYKYEKNAGEDTGKRNIWICWWQGEQNAPALVKKCVNSVREKNPACDVRIISLDNYKSYVDISRTIEDKYISGKIGQAHFSDILRVNLINKYGGLWLDATIFCSQKIPSDIFNYSYYSCKSPRVKGSYVSEYQWTTFVFGGKKNNTFYSFLCDFYNSYWEKNNRAIDYLFADYTIRLAYEKIDFIRKLIDDVPENNLRRDELQNMFDEEYDEDIFKQLMNDSNTCIHKLSWRMEFKETTDDGKQTFYGHFINEV